VAQQLRERMDKWDYVKLKSFCTRKEKNKRKEITHRVGENICQLYIRHKGLNQNIQGTQKTKLPMNQ
jgi:hypothetical protein